MKSLLIKSKLFGDLVIPAGDFEESGDIWDSLCPYLDINVFGVDCIDMDGNSFYIHANIYRVMDDTLCAAREREVLENVELIED